MRQNRTQFDGKKQLFLVFNLFCGELKPLFWV